MVLSAQEPAPEPAESPTGVATVDESTLLLDASPSEGGGASVSPFGIWDLLRMLLVLGAVIGVVYGVFYLLKRGGRGKFVENDAIRIIGSQAMPGNKSMHLVEVGSQVFLVGSAGDSVNLISEITDKETVDAMILKAGNEAAGQRRSFSELVAGMFKGSQGQAIGFMKDQRQRLQRLRQQ